MQGLHVCNTVAKPGIGNTSWKAYRVAYIPNGIKYDCELLNVQYASEIAQRRFLLSCLFERTVVLFW